MTTALPLPRSLHRLTWYAPLLLPVLPLLAALFADPSRRDSVSLIPAQLLLLLGILLSFAAPALVNQWGAAARKEADQLRPAWLAALFVSQLPLLLGTNLADVTLMFFAASCALVASIPFGAEFQQRTLAPLLSEPVARRDWWNLKQGLLASALATHWMAFLLARVAFGAEVDLDLALLLLLVAFIAWGTTPFWTLLTRGLLAGLVLSLAAPLLVLAAITVTAEVWDRYAGGMEAAHLSEMLLQAVRWVGAPAYALVCSVAASRRWFRLEAGDPGPTESLSFDLRSLARGTARPVSPTTRRHSPLVLLLRKEFRLQGLPVLLLLTCALLAAASLVTQDIFPAHDALRAAMLTLGLTAAILAGATPVAEERRLGMLETQHLLPVSRALQWWVKVALAASLVVAVGLVFIAMLEPDARSWETIPQGAVVLGCLFALALLASSLASNALRAMIAAIVATSCQIALLSLTATTVPRLAEQAAETLQLSAVPDAEALRAEVLSLGEGERARLGALTQEGPVTQKTISLLVCGLFVAGVLPALLALALARLNSARAAPSARRGYAQFALCLGLTALLCTITLFAALRQSRIGAREQMLGLVQHTLAWQAALTPAQQRLWEGFRTGPFDWVVRIPLRPTPAQGVVTGGAMTGILLPPGNPLFLAAQPSAQVYLPMVRPDLEVVINRGLIPEDLRNQLREDVPSTPAPPPFSPRMMRRYGVVPPISYGVVPPIARSFPSVEEPTNPPPNAVTNSPKPR